MKKKYDILELGKMSILELTSICDQSSIGIQNQLKQSIIYAIIDRQMVADHVPDESSARDRYAVAEMITSEMNKARKND
jgi:tRNA A37 threonylcarbamoyltransferase TsaD